MVEIDWKKVIEVHPAAEYLDLTKSISVKKDDFITVIQHGFGGELLHSSSDCFIVGEYRVCSTS